jgi:hypothetical protein
VLGRVVRRRRVPVRRGGRHHALRRISRGRGGLGGRHDGHRPGRRTADDDELPARLLDTIALPAERARLADLRTAAPEVRWDRLLFSAKESVFKAWFPLAGRWLGFHQADITIDAAGGFAVRLEVAGPVTAFTSRWLARDGLILTAIAAPARS